MAANREGNLLGEDSQAHSASGGDGCSSLRQHTNMLSDSKMNIEPGLEMETSAERGFRSPGRGQEAAEEPRMGLDMVVGPAAEFMPDWLPPGWTTEVRIRTSGITAGTKDKYFYDPVSHRRFRSKREVFDFLKTGKTARYKSKTKMGRSNLGKMPTCIPNGNNASQTMAHAVDVNNADWSSSNSKHKDISKFDFLNHPEKVRWVLTSAAKGSWKPFIGDEEVSNFNKETWADVFESLSTGADNFQKFDLQTSGTNGRPWYPCGRCIWYLVVMSDEVLELAISNPKACQILPASFTHEK